MAAGLTREIGIFFLVIYLRTILFLPLVLSTLFLSISLFNYFSDLAGMDDCNLLEPK